MRALLQHCKPTKTRETLCVPSSNTANPPKLENPYVHPPPMLQTHQNQKTPMHAYGKGMTIFWNKKGLSILGIHIIKKLIPFTLNIASIYLFEFFLFFNPQYE